jgi:hypothetical protein
MPSRLTEIIVESSFFEFNSMRNALLIFAVFLVAAFTAPRIAAQSTADAAYKIAPATIPPPQELPAPVRDAISPNALSVTDAKGAYCEIWLRKSVPVAATLDKSIGVIFGQIKPGTLVGAIKFESRVEDYRRQPIQPGVYSLRYMLQPVDGNHQGVSPDRDFLLLVPASLDPTPADLPTDTLLDLSRKAAGTGHPSVWNLVPPPDNPPPPNLPAMIYQSDGDLWILYLKAPLDTPVVVGLVLVGHAPES